MDTIGIINETCKLLGIDRLDPDNTDLDDEAVWKSIRDDTTLIFQWESNSAQAYLKKFMSDETIAKVKQKVGNFSYLKWFSFGNGLLRPACASYRDSVSGGDFYDNGFKELNDFLAPEAGRVCMQETIMMFLVKFCGYSQAESDSVRRAIAKKKGTVTLLPEIEQRFIDYSSTHYDITAEKCAEVIKPFLQIILDASSYGFSWNHSDAYSAVGYIAGYLRYYHPLEFLTAAFNTFLDKEEKTTAITEYAKKVGVKISNIKFRHSRAKYSCDKQNNVIYKGMQSIKFLNEDVSEKLYEMRDQKFNTFADLIDKFPGNSKQLDILVKLNYFEEFGGIGYLLNVIELYDKYHKKKTFKKDTLDLPEKIIPVLKKYSSETEKTYRVNDVDGFFEELVSFVKDREIPIESRLKWENEFLGYSATIMPEKVGVWVITAVDTKYSPKMTMYSLSDGKTVIAKMPIKDFRNNPVCIGDTVRVTFEERPKSKLVDGTWVKSTTEKETWIKYISYYNMK